MSVITISREKGSQGSFIAAQVAQILGYHFIDKSTIAKVCAEYGASEFGLIPGYVPDFWTNFNAQAQERRGLMVDMLNRVIQAFANASDLVILGRSSFAVLRDYADVLNVRIQAPLAIRTKRVMERQKIAEQTRAENVVKESDRVRSAFIEWFYGDRWDASRSFDLVINTGKLSSELAIRCIVEVAKALPDKKTPGLHTTDVIQVDPILTSIVAKTLNPDVVHSH